VAGFQWGWRPSRMETRASHSSGLCFDERLSSMKRAAPYLASGVWVNAGSRRLVADDHSGLRIS